MNASNRAAMLERRYRRLIKLLPADHRASRGEELLGLLLDLDQDRARPSIRQVTGLLGLALRLRLPAAVAIVLAAFFVTRSTEEAGLVYDIASGAVSVTVHSPMFFRSLTVAMLVPTALQLSVVTAWILGGRRVTLTMAAMLLTYSLISGLGIPDLIDVAAPVLLVAALVKRWPTPRPRITLLATVPLAALLWTLLAASNVYWPLGGSLLITAIVALLGAAIGLLPHRAVSDSNHPHDPQHEPTAATS